MRILAAIALAGGLLAATAGTALMATVTNDVCSTPNTDFSYTYDSSTLLIQSAIVTNDDQPAVTLTVILTNPTNGNVVWTHTKTFGAGTDTIDVSGQNLHMTQQPGLNFKGQPFNPSPPFNITCSWSD